MIYWGLQRSVVRKLSFPVKNARWGRKRGMVSDNESQRRSYNTLGRNECVT